MWFGATNPLQSLTIHCTNKHVLHSSTITTLTHSPFNLSFLSHSNTMTFTQIFAAIFLLFALYCGLDPFNHSAIANFPNYEVKKVQMPPWSELPTDRDQHNLLQNSHIRFLNQIQGPESIAFDNLGGGPYTGLADGTILFLNHQHNWVHFAYTSPNRYFTSQFLSETLISSSFFRL